MNPLPHAVMWSLNCALHSGSYNMNTEVYFIVCFQIRQYAVKCLSSVWNVKFNNVHCMANLLAGLVLYHDYVGIQVVDAVLEDIRIGMEVSFVCLFFQNKWEITKLVSEYWPSVFMLYCVCGSCNMTPLRCDLYFVCMWLHQHFACDLVLLYSKYMIKQQKWLLGNFRYVEVYTCM